MKVRLLETIFLLMLIFLTTGCAVLGGTSGDNTVTDKPTTPGEQLWQTVKKSNWIVSISILGIAAGVFALVNGAVKLGIASIASASVALFMALAVARFATWMAVFGLIGSVTAALFSILVRRKALMEIIKGGQTFKKWEPKMAEKFNVDQAVCQSTSTKCIVNNMKNNMKLKGEI